MTFLTAAAIAFGVIVLIELPDKTVGRDPRALHPLPAAARGWVIARLSNPARG